MRISATGRNYLINTVDWMPKLVLMALLCLWLVIVPDRSFASNSASDYLRFHHITTRDGLSHPSVNAIKQDKAGFLWFATSNGLTRYDGYEITVYRNNPVDSNSLNSNHITSLLIDQNGQLWVGTSSGLHRYVDEKDHFIRIGDDSGEKSTLHNSTIWSIEKGDDGMLWVGTSNGLVLIDSKNLSVARKINKDDGRAGLNNPDVRALFRDNRDYLWIGTQNGLSRLHPDRDSIQHFTSDPSDPQSLPANFINEIYQDHQGTLWIGTQGGGLSSFQYDAETFSTHSYDTETHNNFNATNVYSILEDSENNLWIGTEMHGLLHFDREQEHFTTYTYEPDNPYSVNEGRINHLYESSEGILWVATRAGGVSFMDRNLHFFSHYTRGNDNEEGLSNNMVRAFEQVESGHIWIGTINGINRFDPYSEQFETFRHLPGDMASIQSKAIHVIHKNDRGLWIGTLYDGLYLMDTEDFSIQHFSHDPDDPASLSENSIYWIFEDSGGVLWIGTNGGGLNRMDPDENHFVRYQNDPDDPNSIGDNDIRVIYEDRNGTFWISSYSGNLTRFSRSENRFYHYEINEDLTYMNSAIKDILEDGEGRFWLASRGGGLILFDRSTGEVSRAYTTDDGLPGNTVHALLEDDNGIIWMSTNNGLSRFDPSMETFQNYDEATGVQKSDFYYNSKLRDRDGDMYFGGYNGFNRFTPENIRISYEQHPVIFTDFQIFNRPVPVGGDSPLHEHISRTDTLTLPHDASMLTFRYSALNFSAIKGNRFAYKMEGFDSNWNYVGSQRTATYTNLGPGEYVFQVMATNNDGIWPESPSSILLVITPPYWRTVPFIISMVLLGSLLLFVAFRLRVRAIHGRNRKLRKMVADRTRKLKDSNNTKDKILSIIAHDLNNVAFGILGVVELLKESVEEKNMEEIEDFTNHLEQNTQQFHVILRNLLTWARSQSGRIEQHPEIIPLSDFIKGHIRQEATRAMKKSIKLHTTVDPENEIYAYADREMLSAVLRNLVNNALKFTHERGEVEVVATVNGSHVEIAVIDNGVGMSGEQLERILKNKKMVSTKGTGMETGTGLGLSVARDFIEKIGGELRIESEEGKGSRFSFLVPKYMENADA